MAATAPDPHDPHDPHDEDEYHPDSPGVRLPTKGSSRTRRLILATLAGSLSLTLALWWFSEPNMKVADFAEPVPTLNLWAVRLTGLLAGLLVFWQVMAMARSPLVENNFDRRALIRWHKWCSVTMFGLLVVHVGARTFGMAVMDAEELEIHPLLAIVHFYYIDNFYALAGLAFVLVALVVVTSTLLRGRLRRAPWHRIHLSVYVVLAAALPHEVLRGTTLSVENPVTRTAPVLWTACLVATIWMVVVNRVVRPLRSREWRLFVHRVDTLFEDENGRVVDVVLRGAPYRDLRNIGFRGGQYALWYFGGTWRYWATAKSYTVSRTVTAREITLTIRVADHAFPRVGTRVGFAGPFGHFTAQARMHGRGGRVLVLASGVGMTPVLPLVDELVADMETSPRDVIVVQRSSDATRLLFPHELDAIAARQTGRPMLGTRVRWNPLLGASGRIKGGSEPKDARVGWVPLGGPDGVDLLRDLLPLDGRVDVYVCGPDDWSRKVIRSLEQLGVSRAQIHFERFE
ncbi:ferredoxin reductase family protein [uncultured Pseudokineococcus sp.]|uniref:ferredoxin reductase family protein n=1 Tax=uncultured Pseudokineococcus sp. TaxID=1642928 RepID=UPI002603C08F|nr:ferredoxin reductase family protein [uncultured Pseudokineococcus sp.]